MSERPFRERGRERGRERNSIHEAPWRPGGPGGKQWQDVSKMAPVGSGARGPWAGAHSRINVKRAHERGPTPGRGDSRERRAGTPTRGRGAARMGQWGQASTSNEFRLSFRSDTLNRTKRLAAQGLRNKAVGQVPVFTGLETFTLRSLALTSLHGLGVHPEVRRIYMQNNVLTSFEGWEMQPRLEELHAEDNLIETLRGLTEQPRLEALWLRGNPVTELYCYRLMCIAAVGKSLRTIDGEAVKRHEVERAMSLGPMVSEAIRDGWVLDTVPAPDADYDMVLEQYAYFRKKSLPLAQWAAAAVSDDSGDEDEAHRWRAQSPYGSRASSPHPSRPGSRSTSRGASPFYPPSRCALVFGGVCVCVCVCVCIKKYPYVSFSPSLACAPRVRLHVVCVCACGLCVCMWCAFACVRLCVEEVPAPDAQDQMNESVLAEHTHTHTWTHSAAWTSTKSMSRACMAAGTAQQSCANAVPVRVRTAS